MTRLASRSKLAIGLGILYSLALVDVFVWNVPGLPIIWIAMFASGMVLGLELTFSFLKRNAKDAIEALTEYLEELE